METTLSGRERLRRILLSAGASALSRGIAFAGSLVTIPIALGHLGTDRFGLWIAIISLLVTLNFADLGIGNGLITTVADATARGDREEVVHQVSSAAAVLLSISLGGAALFFLIDTQIDWGVLLNATTPRGVAEADGAMVVLALCLLVAIPASLAQKIHLGLQEAFVAHLWAGAGSLLAIGGVVTAVGVGASLPWMVLAAAGGPVFTAMLNCLTLFYRRHPDLRPRLSAVSKAGALVASRRGATFLILGISASIAYQADHLIVARILGADAVSGYAVPLKLFFIAPTILGFVLVPLWPAYSEALASGDISWVKTALRRSILGGAGFTAAASGLLIAFGPSIIDAWVGDAVRPATSLLIGMGLWAVVNGIGGPIAMFLNGTDQLRFLVKITVLMAVTNLVLSVLLTRTIGIGGPVYASVVTQVVIVLVPSAIFINRVWPRLAAEHTSSEPATPAEEISSREYRLAP